MSRSTSVRAAMLSSVVFLCSGLAVAQPPRGGPPHGPPPEATQACASKQQGTACSFTAHDRELTGTCEAHPGDSTLSCRPAHHGPPPEALEACQGKQEGATCSVTFHDKTLEGQCHTGRDNELACRPQGGPPGGPHGGPHGGPPPSSNQSGAQ